MLLRHTKAQNQAAKKTYKELENYVKYSERGRSNREKSLFWASY